MKYKKILGLSVFSFLSISFLAASGIKGNVPLVAFAAYSNTDPEEYYKDINPNSENLLKSLQKLNIGDETTGELGKRRTLVGYNSLMSYYRTTDPGDQSGKIRSFYSGKSVSSSSCNREHVWPASRTVGGRGNDPLEDDIHMTRPTLVSENSDRGNSFFTYSTGNGWDPASFDNPSYRGDAARIIFYCMTADRNLKLVDLEDDFSSNHSMGKLSTLLEWNIRYPVSSREKIRNEAAERVQGNRNAFIDHPEYACKIWGNYDVYTKDICSRKDFEPVNIFNDVTDTAIPEEDNYEVGDGIYLAAYQSGVKITDDNRLSWELLEYSNNNALNNDKVILKNYGEGTRYLSVKTAVSFRVKLTIANIGSVIKKFNYKGQLTPPSEESVSKGCGGNVTTASIIISTLSILGINLLLIKRNKRFNKQ